MTAYRKDFDETKYLSFLIKGDELLEKYNEISEKLKDNLKKEFESEPVYYEKYLKGKIISYNGKTNSNFRSKKIPKGDSQYICLSVISIDSLSRRGKHYYSQVFIQECKYVVKKKRLLSIIDIIDISSDSDRENFDEENSDEENTNITHILKLIFETCKNIFCVYKNGK